MKSELRLSLMRWPTKQYTLLEDLCQNWHNHHFATDRYSSACFNNVCPLHAIPGAALEKSTWFMWSLKFDVVAECACISILANILHMRWCGRNALSFTGG